MPIDTRRLRAAAVRLRASLHRFAQRHHPDARTRYLSAATDMADLERRLRTLDGNRQDAWYLLSW